MARGSITEEERTFVETWENIAAYQNGIIRIDHRGDEKPEVIQGEARSFYITTEERLLTQSKIVDAANDPFKNGSFRPVNVPDDITVESNPNALSDEEIFGIFAAGDFAWSEWLTTIDSPATLRRMVTLADEAEGATVKRLRQLEARLLDVKPRTRLETKDPQLAAFLNDAPAGGRERRGQGGRSAAYRDQ